MPTPIVYAPYARPDADLYAAPAIEIVSAPDGTASVHTLQTDMPRSDELARRYWAALPYLSGAIPYMPPVTSAPSARPAAEPPERTVIPQHDTLRLHHVTTLENPFASLIEHELHLHLPRELAPSEG